MKENMDQYLRGQSANWSEEGTVLCGKLSRRCTLPTKFIQDFLGVGDIVIKLA